MQLCKLEQRKIKQEATDAEQQHSGCRRTIEPFDSRSDQLLVSNVIESSNGRFGFVKRRWTKKHKKQLIEDNPKSSATSGDIFTEAANVTPLVITTRAVARNQMEQRLMKEADAGDEDS